MQDLALDPMVNRVLAALRRARLPTGREAETQRRVAEVLTAAGVPFEREYRLQDHRYPGAQGHPQGAWAGDGGGI